MAGLHDVLEATAPPNRVLVVSRMMSLFVTKSCKPAASNA
jgi:hypothetical protein